VNVTVAAGQVSVNDEGPGVAAEDVPHIFERFYRAPAARGMPGAGLGLAIVGQVAKTNGGTADVRTGPAGSTFTLTFPPLPASQLSIATNSDSEPTVPRAEPPLGTKDATHSS
jgi:two-component system, OmpR family, sensor histidine kinase MprB